MAADLTLVLEAAAFVFVIASLAMPAGIGGGLLYVPLLLLLGVTSSASASAALSQPIVVGATLAANLFNFLWQIRNPEKRLVEPRLAVATIAPCLAGVTVGALLNRVLPDVGILLLLVITIIWNLVTTLRKAVSMWRKEGAARKPTTPTASTSSQAVVIRGAPQTTEAAATKKLEESGTPTTSENIEQDCPDTPYSTFSIYDETEEAAHRQRQPRAFDDSILSLPDEVELGGVVQAVGGAEASDRAATVDTAATTGSSDAKPVAAESDAHSWFNLAVIFLFVIASVALRGGKGAPSLVAMCSWPYWTITVGSASVLLLIGFVFRHPEISMVKCFCVGLLSAIVGIGGGIVLNPMLLSLGMDPMKSTATVTVMVLMICTSASFTFAVSGGIPLVPMLILSTASFVGSMSGKLLVGWMVARTGRTSILVFMLAAFMAISGSVVVAQGILKIVESVASGEAITLLQFHSPCPEN